MTPDRRQLVPATLRDQGPLMPPGLRASLEAEIARARTRPRARMAFRPALAAGLAVLLAALAVLLPIRFGGGPPTVVEAHELAGRGPTAGAPPAQRGRPELLDRDLGGVTFPNWKREFGWRATGQRSDEVDGRRMETVFYKHTTHQIAYTIVSGKPLDIPDRAEHLRARGVDLYRFRHGGHDVVVFERGGRTCVVSGHVKHRHTLVKLSSWHGDGRVTF